MVRFKGVSLRYNPDLRKFANDLEFTEHSGYGCAYEYWKERGENNDEDRERSSGGKRNNTDLATEGISFGKEDLLFCVNVWKNIKFAYKNAENSGGFEECINTNNMGKDGSLHLILFDESESNKSKCNFKLFSSLDRTDKFENGLMIGESDVLYSNLKPRIPYADTRKSLMLLQKGGFLRFLGDVVNTKRTRIQREKNNDDDILNEGKDQSKYEFSLIVDVYVYLHLNSLNCKLLARFGGAKNSMRLLLGWLDSEFVLPESEGTLVCANTKGGTTNGSCQSGRRKKRKGVASRVRGNNEDGQVAQIKAEELYSLFKDYEISSKRLGSANWKQPLGLVSELRGYQKDAVLFAKRVEDGAEIYFDYPPYWHMFTLEDREYPVRNKTNKFYANMIDGEISLDVPVGGGTFSIRGGCLCDEMGLGKSLEIISLVLINKRKLENANSGVFEQFDVKDCIKESGFHKEEANFECPCGTTINAGKNKCTESCKLCGTEFHRECCVSEKEYENKDSVCSICENTILDKIDVAATLIISPASIVDQWYDEVNKHVKNGVLRITKYNGVRYVQNCLKKSILKGNSENGVNKNECEDSAHRPKESRNAKETHLNFFSDHIKTRKDVFDYDIVLTSYEVLKEEIYHVMEREDIVNKRSMRYKKSYPILPSLLVNINWWRIVLDEAQMTEGYSLVSKMTNKLTCSHKWCVTGTPIVKSCSNDLFGLISNLSSVGFPFVGDSVGSSLFRRYIGSLSCSVLLKKKSNRSTSGLEDESQNVEEEDSGKGEKNGMAEVVERYKSVGNLVNVLERLVGLVFYRREMEQVKEELSIPRTFYGNTIIDLSSVERFFYVKQCEIGVSNFESTITRLTDFSNLLTYNKKDIDSIVTMLRLACIHPQLGSMGLNHGTGSANSITSRNTLRRNKHDTKDRLKSDMGVIDNDALTSSLNNGLKIMTMDQILDKLLNKCRIEIEESVRKYVMNTLGLAGLHVYKKEMREAFVYYNQVLDIRNEDRVDVLQQIHTLWNLMDVIKLSRENGTDFSDKCDIKLRIEELGAECEKLEYKYRDKYIREYRERLEVYLKSREKTESSDYKTIMDNWWYVLKRDGPCFHYNSTVSEKDLLSQEETLIDKVNDFLYDYRSSRDGEIALQLPNINSVSGLLVLLDIKVKEIEENRRHIMTEMDKLMLFNKENDSSEHTMTVKKEKGLGCGDSRNESPLNDGLLDEIISKVYSCKYCREGDGESENADHLDLEKGRNDENGEYCTLCKMQTYFELLEQCLYTIKKRSKGRASTVSGKVGDAEDPKPYFDSTLLRDSEIVALIKLLSREVRKGSRIEAKNKETDDSCINDTGGIKDYGEECISKIQRSCNSHIKYIELMKLELNNSKNCISSIRQLVNSYLEINDCKQRIQVLDDCNLTGGSCDKAARNSASNLVRQNEVFYYIEKYELERLSALGLRRNLKSQQKFLCSLKLHQKLKQIEESSGQATEDKDSSTAVTELEVCPICLNKISNDYSQVLLPCAHVICIECYKLVKKSNRIKNQCPKCRCSFSDTNVVLIVPECQQIDSGSNNNGGSTLNSNKGGRILRTNFNESCLSRINDEMNIIGNFGTKIQLVIKHILWILNSKSYEFGKKEEAIRQNEDENKGESEGKSALNIKHDDKILVFSDFQQVLDIISEALSLNKVVFGKYNGRKSDYRVLREFQTGSDVRVLICNSLHVGKGVNITSANHIVFVSPLVNKSDELQAIGRIIRMGQKKTPHIWNFVVENSIDEIFFHECSHSSSSSSSSDSISSEKEQHTYVKIANHLVEASKSVSNFAHS
ncbi:helicase [Cryptosporidium ryanae]|uniref:helicase n=1 Tax=Cryptosporidium ryanae TaxID=515981 RepID=UPI00351A29D7|nr:helicase [Cryptosporidium ryanae]